MTENIKNILLETLKFNPNKRIKIIDILKNPYYDECRNIDFE